MIGTTTRANKCCVFKLFWKNSQIGELEGWLFFEQISDGQLIGNQVNFLEGIKSVA